MKTKRAKDLQEGEVFFTDREFATCTVHESKDIFYIAFKIIAPGVGEQFSIIFNTPDAFDRASIFARNVVTNKPRSFLYNNDEYVVIEQ